MKEEAGHSTPVPAQIQSRDESGSSAMNVDDIQPHPLSHGRAPATQADQPTRLQLGLPASLATEPCTKKPLAGSAVLQHMLDPVAATQHASGGMPAADMGTLDERIMTAQEQSAQHPIGVGSKYMPCMTPAEDSTGMKVRPAQAGPISSVAEQPGISESIRHPAQSDSRSNQTSPFQDASGVFGEGPRHVDPEGALHGDPVDAGAELPGLGGVLQRWVNPVIAPPNSQPILDLGGLRHHAATPPVTRESLSQVRCGQKLYVPA